MAISAIQITTKELRSLDAWWPAVLGLYNDDTRCATSAAVIPPTKEGVTAHVQAGGMLAMALEGDTPYGYSIWSNETGRISWHLAESLRFSEATLRLVELVAAISGLQPWGVVDSPVVRNRFLESGIARLSTDHPKYLPGTVITWDV